MSQQAGPTGRPQPAEDASAGGNVAGGVDSVPATRNQRTFINALRAGLAGAFFYAIWRPSAAEFRNAWPGWTWRAVPNILREVTDRVLDRFPWILELGQE
ncbi:uncharacterized protein PG986_010565 [Apiospora aurea]|uniref:Uncharacterized protein n=1 Tax=Apiospora aurea TaxID=335848 RepID=A0ABR1Q2L5_9PEZI